MVCPFLSLLLLQNGATKSTQCLSMLPWANKNNAYKGHSPAVLGDRGQSCGFCGSALPNPWGTAFPCPSSSGMGCVICSGPWMWAEVTCVTSRRNLRSQCMIHHIFIHSPTTITEVHVEQSLGPWGATPSPDWPEPKPPRSWGFLLQQHNMDHPEEYNN